MSGHGLGRWRGLGKQKSDPQASGGRGSGRRRRLGRWLGLGVAIAGIAIATPWLAPNIQAFLALESTTSGGGISVVGDRPDASPVRPGDGSDLDAQKLGSQKLDSQKLDSQKLDSQSHSQIDPTETNPNPQTNPQNQAQTKQSNAAIALAKPIDCTLGQDCFVLLYPDRNPADGQQQDFQCRHLTYDQHQGTDFAIPFRTPNTAVNVLAAAPGQVVNVRDGVRDRRLQSSTEQASVEGFECGNGVLIAHPQGWHTQYCHLKQGSVRVQPGQTVQTGTVLGLVGESGMTTFPHVHITVRQDGRAIDPFVGPGNLSGCGGERSPLWAESIPYRPTGLIRAGFATAAPNADGLWSGQYQNTTLAATSPALIFWVQLYGTEAGDEETFQLVNPDGAVVIDNARKTLDRPYQTWQSFVGQRNRDRLRTGTWRAAYTLRRQGQTLLQLERQVQVR